MFASFLATSGLINFLIGRSLLGYMVSLGFYVLLSVFSYKLAKKLRFYLNLMKHAPLCFELVPEQLSSPDLSKVKQLFQALTGIEYLGLEIVSTSELGIRFYVSVREQDTKHVKAALLSYMPGLNFVDSRLERRSNRKTNRVLRFKFSQHFSLSLHESIGQSDVLPYVMGSMSNLGDNDFMGFQLILTPPSKRQVDKLRGKAEKQRSIFLWPWPVLLFQAFISKLRPKVSLGSNKVYAPLLAADIRVLIESSDRSVLSDRAKSMTAALAAFSASERQTLQPEKGIIAWLQTPLLKRLYCFRLPGFGHKAHLSPTELAGLFHFPVLQAAYSELTNAFLSRTLPLPQALRSLAALDIVFGENVYQRHKWPVGLDLKQRERHVYVVGGTGTGKTTLLLGAILQDIKSGKGVAVIDPHGDLAEQINALVPPERLNDLIYFDPADLDTPMGVNLLELPKNVSDNELLLAKDFITESVVSLFRKVFSEEGEGGHRIEYILRNAIHTAFSTDNPTLASVYMLLTDYEFRKNVVNSLVDDDLKAFWFHEYGLAGSMQRVKMSAGLTAKLGRFMRSETARRVFVSETSTLDFEGIINTGKILICNFSKGKLGEDTASLFGISVLTKLQLAAYRRQDIPESERRPFYLYVDEFQTFATKAFTQLLSEARKYRFYLTLAEQSTSQQNVDLISNVLANVGCLVCFRSGSIYDEKLLLPLLEPYLQKQDIANLPIYNFYMRVTGEKTYAPFSGRTVV